MMTDLKDKDFLIGNVDEIDGFSSEHYKDKKGKDLIIIDCENPEQLKKQILVWQEFWNFFGGNPDYVKQTENALRILRQENKQLKEQAQFKKKLAQHNEKEFVKLQEIVQKVREIKTYGDVIKLKEIVGEKNEKNL